jgi:23S rRNA pseudouridine1911/1915/1917 synthase
MDKLFFLAIPGLSLREFLLSFRIAKTYAYKMQTDKLVEVNGEYRDFSYILKPGDVVSIDIESFEIGTIETYDYPLAIIYEDEDILIVNKPQGMLVHSDGHDNKTLNNAVAYHYQQEGIKRRVRHCHRLDYETGGLLLYAKHFLAHAFLNDQIEKRSFKKKYYALVTGKMQPESGLIDLKIGRNRHLRNQYMVSHTGKESLTYYQTIKSNEKSSLLDIEIRTGRTHQIRVHFSHLHHPLIGDAIYGTPGQKLMLEAYYMSFIHPRTREIVEFFLPVPDDFWP